MTEAVPTILVLSFARRDEGEAIAAAMAALSREFPDARFAAIGTPVSEPILEGLGINDIIVYGDGRTARQAVREARSRAPQATAVIYGGPGASGHLKLEALALVTGGGRLYRCLPDRPPRPIGRLRLAVSVAAKALTAGARLAAAAFACCVALCWLRVAQMTAGGRDAGRA